MASTKISALAAGAPGQATDLLPIARAGANFSLQLSDVLGGTGAGYIIFSNAGVPTQSANLTFTGGNLLTVTGGITASGTVTASTQFNVGSTDVILNRSAANLLAITGDGTGSSGTTVGWLIGNFGSGASGLWSSVVSKSSTNYALLANASSTQLNSTTTTTLNVGDSTKLSATSTGVAVTGNLTASGTVSGAIIDSTSAIAFSNPAANHAKLYGDATGSGLGAVLVGSGATFDVYIGNKTGGAVMTVPTGTTGATFSSLGGTGSRAVVADSAGLLSAPVSDATLKQNMKDLPDSYGRSVIMALRPKIFDYKDHEKYGAQNYLSFDAEETAEILPEVTGQMYDGDGPLVDTGKKDAKGGSIMRKPVGTYYISKEDIIPALVLHNKQMQTQIDALAARLAAAGIK